MGSCSHVEKHHAPWLIGQAVRSEAATVDGALDPFMAAALSLRVTGCKVDVEDVD